MILLITLIMKVPFNNISYAGNTDDPDLYTKRKGHKNRHLELEIEIQKLKKKLN